MNRPRQHAVGFLSLLVYMGLLVTVSGPASEPTTGFEGTNRPAPREVPVDVTLCDLEVNPTTSNGRLVRVSAVLVDYRDGHSAWLYSTERCRLSLGSVTMIDVADDSKTRRPFIVERIRRTVDGYIPRRVAVVAVGRYRSGELPYAFEIEGLESIDPLTDDDHWPWPDEHCSQ